MSIAFSFLVATLGGVVGVYVVLGYLHPSGGAVDAEVAVL